MKPLKPSLLNRILQAAELRAGGASWETVAAQVGRSADTVRHWPNAYPDVWKQALHDAEQRLVSDAGAEAVLTLRRLLRSDDEKVRRDAARFLVNLRVERDKLERRPGKGGRTPAGTDAQRLAEFVEGLDDAQVHAILDELAGEPGTAAGGAAAEAGD